MELDMIRNGHNFERRKMYPLNPRNNMVSTIDISWTRSLEDQNNFSTSKLKNRNSQEKQLIKNHYNELLDKKIQQEKSLEKSSFRVLPIQKTVQPSEERFIQNRSGLHQSFHQRRSSFGDTNNFNTSQRHHDESRAMFTSKQILQPVTVKKPELSRSGKLSQSVFGYEINPESFKRESYLSKLLNDRLDPYLEQATHYKHNSIMANQIINLNY